MIKAYPHQAPREDAHTFKFDKVDEALIKYYNLFIKKKDKSSMAFSKEEDDQSSQLKATDKIGSAVTEDLTAIHS